MSLNIRIESKRVVEEIRQLPEIGEAGTIISLQECGKCKHRSSMTTLRWEFQEPHECNRCQTPMDIVRYTADSAEGMSWIRGNLK